MSNVDAVWCLKKLAKHDLQGCLAKHSACVLELHSLLCLEYLDVMLALLRERWQLGPAFCGMQKLAN